MTIREVHATLDVAERDLMSAEKILNGEPILETAAYFVQQAAEKYVKAALTHLGVSYSRRGMQGHDNELLARSIPTTNPLRALADKLAPVKPWATSFRYHDPGVLTPVVPTATELRSTIADIRAFGCDLEARLPGPKSAFVASLTMSASTTGRAFRNRVDLILSVDEIKALDAGTASFEGHEAATAIVDHAYAFEVEKKGSTVQRTGLLLVGRDAIGHLASTGGSSTNRSRRVHLSADAVDEVAESATGPLAASFKKLGDLMLVREERWAARTKHAARQAQRKTKGKGGR